MLTNSLIVLGMVPVRAVVRAKTTERRITMEKIGDIGWTTLINTRFSKAKISEPTTKVKS